METYANIQQILAARKAQFWFVAAFTAANAKQSIHSNKGIYSLLRMG